MQLATSHEEVHSVGIKSSVLFRVASNAHVMKMLSSQLYSDKIASPLREISCNSIDAHISAGCPTKPFLVHLPCHADPTFSVRDFGLGMSKKDLEELYSVYGLSDKNQSNDFVGCLGLGSKSPFAYTDSFTATSIHKGQKYVCIASKGRDGIPTLNLMDSGTTDAPSGMEISFAVTPSDFNTFIDRAKSIYRHFPVLPTITGGAGKFIIDKPKITLQGNGWRLYENSNETSYAIMGYVAYEIEPKFFSKHFDSSNGNTWYSRYSNDDNMEVGLLQLGLELHFSIGGIEMNISREGLEYTPTTIDAIKTRLTIVSQELSILVNEHFRACTSVFEARCLYQSLKTQFRGLSKIIQTIKPTWNGVDISKQIYIKNTDNLALQVGTCGRITGRTHVSRSINTVSGTLFYLNDLKKGGFGIVERDSDEKRCQICLITLKGTDKEMEDALSHFLDEVGIDKSQLIKISTLPQVKKQTNYGPRQTKQFVFIPERDHTTTYNYRNRRISKREWWKEITIDLNTGGVYVSLDGFTSEFNKKHLNPNEFNIIIEYAEKLGLKIPEKICGIRPSHVKKIEGGSNWTSLYEYLKEQLHQFITKHKYCKTLLEEIIGLNNLGEDNPLMTLIYSKINNGIDTNGVCGKFLNNVNRIIPTKNALRDKLSHLTKLVSVLEYDLGAVGQVYEFQTEMEKVMKHYPILSLLPQYSLDRKHIPTLVSYIQLIDSSTIDVLQ